MIEQTLLTLRPKASPKPLIRVGGDQDGAYLLPDDLVGIRACFSPGVSNRKDFEDELTDRYGITCHMCDFSSDVERFRTPLRRKQSFKKKWLDVNNSPDSISLESWVNELSPKPEDDLLLQMDIEGAEYRNLLHTPEKILRRFRIIIIELHRLRTCLDEKEFRKELGPLLELLDKHFICVHAHPNNCCGDFLLEENGWNIPNVHELTFLRRDRWQSAPSESLQQPLLPHPLDIRGNVASKPPIFLNEHWLESGRRQTESEIKMLRDQVDYLQRALHEARADFQETTAHLHRLARNAVATIPRESGGPNGTLVDLASGKSFVLSSTHRASPKNCLVSERRPFFFHTAHGRNQSICVDLGSRHELHELIHACPVLTTTATVG
jgi:hypothetical protein